MVSAIRNDLSTALIGTSALATAGWLGGKSLQLVIPAVVPSAHAMALGLALPASTLMYAVASKINDKGGAVNIVLSLITGYLTSVTAANLLGFSVSTAAPFMGLTAFVVLAGTVCLVTLPIIVVLGTCLGCNIPAMDGGCSR